MGIIEKFPVSKLTPAEGDLYGDVLRAAARASSRGVDGATVVSLLIGALVKEARNQGVSDMSQVVEGVAVAIGCTEPGAARGAA